MSTQKKRTPRKQAGVKGRNGKTTKDLNIPPPIFNENRYENIVLAGMLRYGRFAKIPYSYFANRKNRQTYSVIARLQREGKPIDSVAVLERMNNDPCVGDLVTTETVESNFGFHVSEFKNERREQEITFYTDLLKRSRNGNSEGLDFEIILEKLNQLQVEEQGGNYPFGGSLTLDEIAQKVILPPEWVSTHLCIKGQLNVIGGAPGMGKTFLSTAIGLCAAAGQPVYSGDTASEPLKTFYVGMEGGELLQRRVQGLRRGYGLFDKHIPFTLQQEDLELYKPEKRQLFLKAARRGDFDFVVFDTFRTCFALSEMQDEGWQPVINFLVQLSKHVTVLVIHHFRKNKNGKPTIDDLSGSGQFGASIIFGLALSGDPEDVKVTAAKTNYVPFSFLPFPMSFAAHTENFMLDNEASTIQLIPTEKKAQEEKTVEEEKKKNAILKFLRVQGGLYSVNRIREAEGVPKNHTTVQKYLEELHREGKVYPENGKYAAVSCNEL